MSSRHCENTASAEVYSRRERCRQSDASVSVPAVADPDRWKNERQRCGRHDVFDGQVRRGIAVAGSVEHLDVATLHPAYALPGGVIEANQGNRFEPTLAKIAPDSLDCGAPDRSVEDFAQ